jgi:Icc-related predicted phosphoesterase
VMKPVGSTAVRDAILTHQPMLSLHGHIHESRGVKRTGRTLSINPGSVYGDGVLQGAVLDLNAKKGKVARYLLVNG